MLVWGYTGAMIAEGVNPLEMRSCNDMVCAIVQHPLPRWRGRNSAAEAGPKYDENEVFYASALAPGDGNQKVMKISEETSMCTPGMTPVNYEKLERGDLRQPRLQSQPLSHFLRTKLPCRQEEKRINSTITWSKNLTQNILKSLTVLSPQTSPSKRPCVRTGTCSIWAPPKHLRGIFRGQR